MITTWETWLEWLHAAANMNQYQPADRKEWFLAEPGRDTTADDPGHDFNIRGTWDQTGLFAAGWEWERQTGPDCGFVRRPGKKRGVSGTLDMITGKKGWKLFHCFSTSDPTFEGERSYSRFAVYAILNHGGDFKAAAAALAGMGFGRRVDQPTAVFGAEHTCPPPGYATEGDTAGGVDDGITPDFDFATNADFKNLDLTTAWVWPDWLQGGVANMLASEAGLGKTRMIADLCRRVHHRLPWPDGKPMQKFDGQYIAMWVAADHQFAELVELSDKFGFGDRICYSGSKTNPVGGITLDTAEEFKSLYRKVKAARPLFLFVDTAGGATSANLSRQEEARRFYSPLSHIAVSLGVCVVVVTHLNSSQKVLGRRGEERVRCVIRLWAADKRPETPRRLEMTKSNHLFPAPIGMTLHDHGSEYNDSPPQSPEDAASRVEQLDKGPPTKVRECAEWLERLLADAPRRLAQVFEEAEDAGISRPTLYRAKALLKIKEIKDEKGHKWWGIPGTGGGELEDNEE